MATDRQDEKHIPERRRCSDKECSAARSTWFTEEILPKLMIRFWIGLVTTLVALAGVNEYMNRNTIRDFELKVVGIYESKESHRMDIAEIKTSMSALGDAVAHSMNKIIDNQQIIIEGVKRNK